MFPVFHGTRTVFALLPCTSVLTSASVAAHGKYICWGPSENLDVCLASTLGWQTTARS